MAKENKFKDSLNNMGSLISSSVPKTPIQTTIPIKTIIAKTEETRFTVHIPTVLMDQIKDIGHINKKKIKAMFVEALEAYASKNKI